MQSGKKEQKEGSVISQVVLTYTAPRVSGPPEFVALFNEIKGICESGGDLSQLSGNWDDMLRLCGKMVDGFTAVALQSYRDFLEAYETKTEKGERKEARVAVASHAERMRSWAINLVLQAGENLEFRSLVVASIINMAYKAAFENNDYYSAQALFSALQEDSVYRLIERDVLPVLPEEIRARQDKLFRCVIDPNSESYAAEFKEHPHAIQMLNKILTHLERAGEASRDKAAEKQTEDQLLKSVRSGLDEAAIEHKDKKRDVVEFLQEIAASSESLDDAYQLSLKIKQRGQHGGTSRDIFKEAKLSTLLTGTIMGELKERALAYRAIEEATKEPGFYIHNEAKQALAEALLTGDKEEVAAVLLNREEHGFVEFIPRGDDKTSDESVIAIATSLLQKMAKKSLPENFGAVVINGSPERIATVLKEGGVNITPEQAIDIKQNYYRSKISSPLFREQIRAMRIDVHVNKQINPAITVQARLHAFRSTTEYVINKVNEAQADKDFAALAKYLPMLGFSEPQAKQLIELQQAYLAIDSSIEQGVFNIKGSKGKVEEAKKALAEALLNVGNTDKDPVKKRQARIAKVVGVLEKYNFVLLPPDKSTNIRLVNRVVYSDILDNFVGNMLSHPLEAARKILGEALLSGNKAEIAAVLTSEFGMPKGGAADEMALELQRRLTAQVLQESFSSTISLEVPIPVSQSKKQVVAEVSPPQVEVVAKLSSELQAESVVITPQMPPDTSVPKSDSKVSHEDQLKEQREKPLPLLPPLTQQIRSPIVLDSIRRMLKEACKSKPELMDEVDRLVGQRIREKGAKGGRVEASIIKKMIEETSKLELSKAIQAIPPEPVVQSLKSVR